MKRRCRAKAFTLIEVLVALAILAVSLGAGLRAAAIATDNSNSLKERMLARWVAKNQLARMQLQPELPNVGVQSGEAAQASIGFSWRAEIESTPNPDIRRATLSVMRQGSEHALYQLQGFLSVRK